ICWSRFCNWLVNRVICCCWASSARSSDSSRRATEAESDLLADFLPAACAAEPAVLCWACRGSTQVNARINTKAVACFIFHLLKLSSHLTNCVAEVVDKTVVADLSGCAVHFRITTLRRSVRTLC